MAYSNTGTPRFFINYLEWLDSIGSGVYGKLNPEDPEEITRIDASIFSTISKSSFSVYPYSNITILFDKFYQAGITPYTLPDKQFFAILGHKFSSESIYWNVIGGGAAGINLSAEVDGFTLYNTGGTLINITGGVGSYIPGESTIKNFFLLDIDEAALMGSVVIGTYYDMPHSPDLKLTMTREMDGVKRIRTRGGADLVNHKYIKPAMWGDAGAWELYSGTPNQALSRSGRRVWDLSFSYLQDSDLFPMLSSLNPYESTSASGEVYSELGYSFWNRIDPMGGGMQQIWGQEIFEYFEEPATTWHLDNTLLDSNNFYSQVIHKTNGGQLPFIFQPDKDNNNPDGFAICKFDMKSFKFEQVANGIYNIKLKIREVW